MTETSNTSLEETLRAPEGDVGLRILGMVIGGGAGGLLLVVVSTYGGIDVAWLLGLPGVSLALISGAFSLRRDRRWGVVTALVGVVWTVVLLWLRSPTRIGLGELALRLPLTAAGAVQLTIVVVAGLLAGAGWRKPPLPDIDPETETDLD